MAHITRKNNTHKHGKNYTHNTPKITHITRQNKHTKPGKIDTLNTAKYNTHNTGKNDTHNMANLTLMTLQIIKYIDVNRQMSNLGRVAPDYLASFYCFKNKFQNNSYLSMHWFSLLKNIFYKLLLVG